MTFEEWWADYTDNSVAACNELSKKIAHDHWQAGWSAATTEANRKLGDQSNEAEKAQRCKDAVEALLVEAAYDLNPERIRAIIQKAQG